MNETFVRVFLRLNEVQKEIYCEKWKEMIIDFFYKNKHTSSYLLNDIAMNIKKPKLSMNIVIEDFIKLKKLLIDDPKKRFILQGELNKTRVYLSKQVLSTFQVYSYLR